MQSKICPCCKKVFLKSTRYGPKQWKPITYCSRLCAGLKVPIQKYKENKLKQFLSNTIALDNGCLEWKGCFSPNGYGIIRFCGKNNNAHRVIYMLLHGELKHSEFVLHSCDNRKCVNPSHLFKGSHQDNMDDMVKKQRSKSGEECHFSKTTNLQHRQIKHQILSNIPAEVIAYDFGLSKKYIKYLMHKYVK